MTPRSQRRGELEAVLIRSSGQVSEVVDEEDVHAVSFEESRQETYRHQRRNPHTGRSRLATALAERAGRPIPQMGDGQDPRLADMGAYAATYLFAYRKSTCPVHTHHRRRRERHRGGGIRGRRPARRPVPRKLPEEALPGSDPRTGRNGFRNHCRRRRAAAGRRRNRVQGRRRPARPGDHVSALRVPLGHEARVRRSARPQCNRNRRRGKRRDARKRRHGVERSG